MIVWQSVPNLLDNIPQLFYSLSNQDTGIRRILWNVVFLILFVISFPTMYVSSSLKKVKMNKATARITKTKLAILELCLSSTVDRFFATAFWMAMIASRSCERKILNTGKTRPRKMVRRIPNTNNSLLSFK